MIQKRNTNASFTFVFMTVLIDIIGLGIIFPIVPELISQFVGHDIAVAAQYGGWLTLAYALMQFIFAPVLGNLSDRYGRRPVLLISLSTLGINCLFMAYAPSIFWLFVGRIIGGMTGGSYSVAAAYVTDISDTTNRTKYFGLLSTAYGLGFIIGPVLGGLLAKWGITVPFIVAAAMSFINVIYGFFALPESLDKDKRRKFDLKRANPLGAFLYLKQFPFISGLLIAYFFIYFAGHSMDSVWAYYTIERYGWNTDMIGYSMGFLGFMLILIQGVFIRQIIVRIGEKMAIYVGLLIQCITLISIAFTTQGWMIFILIIPYAFGAISAPSLQTITSNQIPQSSQGELQGGLASLASLTAIASPPIMTGLFAKFSNPHAPFYCPGMPFLFASLLLGIGLILIARTLNKKNSKT